ncbi:MAG: FG-GAP-like repeat-containing protein [Planctomycetota bacterium]
MRPAENLRPQDFDDDGDLDIVLIRSRTVELWVNEGAREFRLAKVVADDLVEDAWVGDLDGDLRYDVVTFPLQSTKVEVRFGRTDGELTPPKRFEVGRRANGGLVADFDGDGRLDILASHLREGNRLAGFSLLTVDRSLAKDTDGDGKLDECEIADGASDCNGDGIPDDDQPQSDINEDGIHDSCQNQDYAYTLDGPDEIFGLPGTFVSAEYTASIETWNQGPPAGIQGWAISVTTEGPGVTVWATTDGTKGASVREGGLRNTGFEKTEVVEGEVNGAVSAIVLSVTMPIVLPKAPNVVLRIGVDWLTSDPEDDVRGRVVFRDGLQGSGQPVRNVFTYQGGGRQPFLMPHSVRVSSVELDFQRGDANADGRVDISDSIFVLSYLFLGGEAPPCLSAADADDSGALDLTDGAFINLFLFLGGMTPPAPGPFRCGEDPTRDLGCHGLGSCS